MTEDGKFRCPQMAKKVVFLLVLPQLVVPMSYWRQLLQAKGNGILITVSLVVAMSPSSLFLLIYIDLLHLRQFVKSNYQLSFKQTYKIKKKQTQRAKKFARGSSKKP